MKLKFSIVILILFSFLNVKAFSGSLANEDSSYELETQCLNKSEFVENGVKVQYKTKVDKSIEDSKINSYFKAFGLNQISSNNLNYVNEKLNIKADIWNDSIYTYVDITLINSDISYKNEELRNIVEKLIDENSEEVQYFYYYKGKVDDVKKEGNKQILEEVMSESILNKADILEVNNGYTGNVVLKNSEKINFAISTYSTGTYLIIGTPIIFVAY